MRALFLLDSKTMNKIIIRDATNKKESRKCFVFSTSKSLEKEHEGNLLQYEKFGFLFPNFKQDMAKIISNTDLLVHEAIQYAINKKK